MHLIEELFGEELSERYVHNISELAYMTGLSRTTVSKCLKRLPVQFTEQNAKYYFTPIALLWIYSELREGSDFDWEITIKHLIERGHLVTKVNPTI